MKILLFPQWEHDFHKITVFTFSSNFDPKWDPKPIYFSQKRARRDPKITKIAEKSSFLVDQNPSSNFGRKKRKIKRIRWRRRRVAGTMCNVGGRVREGKPPKLWSNFGHDPKTPATGAVDLRRLRLMPPTPR